MTDAGAPPNSTSDMSSTASDTVHQGGFDLGGPPEAGKPYRVLARKYRPSSFEDLIGQDAVVRTVSNAFETVRTTASWPIRSSKLEGRYLRASTR